MLTDLPSLLRVTLYKGPSYSEKRARVVECAAKQGLPAAERMSHGPPAGAAPALLLMTRSAAPKTGNAFMVSARVTARVTAWTPE